nr:MAG TPA: hypothetical protein [Bacteriophage sp.]
MTIIKSLNSRFKISFIRLRISYLISTKYIIKIIIYIL